MHFPILQKFETLELFSHSLPGTEDCLGSKISQTAASDKALHPSGCRKLFQVLALRHTPEHTKAFPSAIPYFQVLFPYSESFILTKHLTFKDTFPAH